MNESKSQLLYTGGGETLVVTNIRISMNESKSQLDNTTTNDGSGCYKYQNINERKQITTALPMLLLIR